MSGRKGSVLEGEALPERKGSVPERSIPTKPTSLEEQKAIGNYKLWLNFEVLIVVVLFVSVWSLMSLPIIFYHLPIPEVRIVQECSFTILRCC